MKYIIMNHKGQYFNNHYYRDQNRLTNKLIEAHRFSTFEMLLAVDKLFKGLDIVVIEESQLNPLETDLMKKLECDLDGIR